MSVRTRIRTTAKVERTKAGRSVTSTSAASVIIKTVEGKKEADAYHATVRVEVRQVRHTADGASLTVAEAADSWIMTAEGNGLDGGGQQRTLELHVARDSGA